MADFAIVIRLVRLGRPTLSTYFGKIGSIWQSGNHLRNRKGLIEVVSSNTTSINRKGLIEVVFDDTTPVSPTDLYIKMSAFGTQCVYLTEAHFRADLAKTLHEMSK